MGKFLLGAFVGVIVSVIMAYKSSYDRLEGLQNAAEWGCYEGTKKMAYSLKEEERYRHFDAALSFCPEAAKKFRDWIEKG
jgi:hypothetical protein